MPRSQGGGYGAGLKDEYRRYYGSTIGFSGRGEQIPNPSSYCELDPTVKDRWGIPVLRFHWKWADHEYNQVRHMQETFRELIREMGGEPLGEMPSQARGYGIANGGAIIHELGTVRMGNDALDARNAALQSGFDAIDGCVNVVDRIGTGKAAVIVHEQAFAILADTDVVQVGQSFLPRRQDADFGGNPLSFGLGGFLAFEHALGKRFDVTFDFNFGA
ncbi:MAG: hypothetical protein HC771_25030 [Synechococcales cyanobacterium CRU_2_2]|nr:hypothetical protein [Synechococcales cyanobacterium CRU_2_2]